MIILCKYSSFFLISIRQPTLIYKLFCFTASSVSTYSTFKFLLNFFQFYFFVLIVQTHFSSLGLHLLQVLFLILSFYFATKCWFITFALVRSFLEVPQSFVSHLKIPLFNKVLFASYGHLNEHRSKVEFSWTSCSRGRPGGRILKSLASKLKFLASKPTSPQKRPVLGSRTALFKLVKKETNLKPKLLACQFVSFPYLKNIMW